MLGEHDRRVGVLVDAAQEPDELVAGDRIELGGRLVEDDDPRAPGQSGAERHPLELPARQLGGGAIQQLVDGQRERRLLHPARHYGGRQPAVLQPERQLGADRARDDLALGILEQRPDRLSQLAGAVIARVHARDRRPPGERAAVKVRNQAADRAQQR
jgi:hypothetical protein